MTIIFGFGRQLETCTLRPCTLYDYMSQRQNPKESNLIVMPKGAMQILATGLYKKHVIPMYESTYLRSSAYLSA